MEMKELLTASLIANPASGQGNPDKRREQLQTTAKSLGWIGRYCETTEKESTQTLVKEEIKRGVKHIVVCGEDGTAMEAISMIINKNVTLGIVPLGTANILARSLSLPLSLKEALKTALLGNPKQIDIGKVNNHYFSILAGIGLMGDMMQSTTREDKNKLSIFAYILSALKNLNNKSSLFKVALDNKKPFTVRAKAVLVSNIGALIKGVEIVPEADPQSGVLTIGIIKTRSLASWISVITNTIFKQADKSTYYDKYIAKKIKITLLHEKRAYQCDGEYFPPTNSLSVEIIPKAVTILTSPEIITKPQKEKKVLLFDFDGTLADSFQMMVSIYKKLSKKHKFAPATPESIEQMRGLSAREVIGKLPIAKYKLPILFMEGKKEFIKHIADIKPFPELASILPQLSKQYTLGIVTSNDPTTVKEFLITHNMDHFDFVYSDGSLFGKGKIIKKLLKKYNYPKNNVLYIGDEVRDIDAAREAHIKIASVTWGFNSEKGLMKNNPDFVIKTPKDLKNITF